MHESVRALGGGSVLRAADVDVGQARSPHLTWRPEQIDVGLDDVKGLGPLREEVTETLNLFLGYATSRTGSAAPPAGHPVRGQAGHRQDPHGQGDGPPRRGADGPVSSGTGGVVTTSCGLAVPLPARGAPSLLARRPAPPAPLADPGQGE